MEQRVSPSTSGPQNPYRNAVLVFTFATVVYYIGYIVLVAGYVRSDLSGVIIAGLVLMIIGGILYFPGFALYKQNSGKPHFVGYVLQGSSAQPPIIGNLFSPGQPGPVVYAPPPMAMPSNVPYDNPPAYNEGHMKSVPL